MIDTLTSEYTNRNGHIQEKIFKIGDLVALEKRSITSLFAYTESSVETEMGYITKFVEDLDRKYSSFIMEVIMRDNKILTNTYTSRVYLTASRDYAPQKMEILSGKIEDFPEYLL